MRILSTLSGFTALLVLSCYSGAYAAQQVEEDVTPPIALVPTLGFSNQGLQISDPQLGSWQVHGVLTGLAAAQSNTSNESPKEFGDVSNAQVMLQKTSGWLQFFAMAGAYDMPALTTNYRRAYTQTEGTWGFLPLGSVTVAPNSEWSINIGKIIAIGGGENTFTYENFNVQRGVLATLTNLVTRGVQLNYQGSGFSTNIAWTDGSYSNTYNWLSGQVTLPLNDRHSFNASWTGAVSKNDINTMATSLLQNNSQITTLVYNFNSPYWSLAPYLQMTVVPAAPQIGILGASGSQGAAVMGTYRFTPLVNGRASKQNISLPLRLEYINSWGNSGFNNNNLLFGPNSSAWSATLTPTWQRGVWFARLEGSYVRALNPAPTAAFGLNGNTNNQARIMLETGLIF